MSSIVNLGSREWPKSPSQAWKNIKVNMRNCSKVMRVVTSIALGITAFTMSAVCEKITHDSATDTYPAGSSNTTVVHNSYCDSTALSCLSVGVISGVLGGIVAGVALVNNFIIPIKKHGCRIPDGALKEMCLTGFPQILAGGSKFIYGCIEMPICLWQERLAKKSIECTFYTNAGGFQSGVFYFVNAGLGILDMACLEEEGIVPELLPEVQSNTEVVIDLEEGSTGLLCCVKRRRQPDGRGESAEVMEMVSLCAPSASEELEALVIDFDEEGSKGLLCCFKGRNSDR